MSKELKAREGHLRRLYGLTLEQYDQLLQEQAGCCGVCGKHEAEFPVRLAVDHNHKTGEIRGLLCRYCNHRLVGRHTDADLVQKIADYLRKGTGWFAPKKKPRARKTTRRRRTTSTKTTTGSGSS